MSKLTFQIIIIGIVIATAATLNIRGVQASEGAEILQISVRAQSTANYDVDTDFGTIPAISIGIVDDKINDQSSDGSNPPLASLPITTAPTQDHPESAGPAPQSISEPQSVPAPQASSAAQASPAALEDKSKEEEKALKEEAKEEEKALKEEVKEEEKALKEEVKEEEKALKEEVKEEEKALKEEAKEEEKSTP